MDQDRLSQLEEKLLQLIEQNETSKREQERFVEELEKRDKRIGDLDKTLRQIQKDHKSARGKLDTIIEKLEAFT
jgi:septal ring factor EnvC (AmiA/AmiB activator)